MGNSIFETLKRLHLASAETRVLFNSRTRDIDGLKVWRDEVSGVIYIDDFFAGNDTYIDGSFRQENRANLSFEEPSFERSTDARRRLESYFQFFAGKRIMDFGCGAGDFLFLAKKHCKNAIGVELQRDFVHALNSDGIKCFSDLNSVERKSIDTCVSFHVVEHLPNPLEELERIKNKIVGGGFLVLEVPHANDFLLSILPVDQFKQFTLWSQHLILHTRESLQRMLAFVGFKDIRVEGVQRYPLSNHLNWCVNGEPGGHKSSLSMIDSPMLQEAYSNSLVRLDASDTLVAIARAPF